MPAALTRADRSLLLTGAAVLVVIVVIALVIGPAAEGSDTPTSHSANSRGVKAAYLLLQQSGYRVERWTRPPAELRDPEHATLVLFEPSAMPPADREAIGRFLSAGGRIIATGASGALALDGLVEPRPFGEAWIAATPTVPSTLALAARTITIESLARWIPSGVPAVPLFSHGGDAVAVRVQRGMGEALWWSSPLPATNIGLTESDNLAFFLAAIGPPGDRRIVWDEYFHGYRSTLASTVLQSSMKWVFVQIAIVAVVVLVTFVRRSGPIVSLVTDTRLSPLEFVRTLGALYGRARVASAPVEIAYARFRALLTHDLGIASTMTPERVVEAVSARRPDAAVGLLDAMHTCEEVRGATPITESAALALVQRLHDQHTAIERGTSRRVSARETH